MSYYLFALFLDVLGYCLSPREDATFFPYSLIVCAALYGIPRRLRATLWPAGPTFGWLMVSLFFMIACGIGLGWYSVQYRGAEYGLASVSPMIFLSAGFRALRQPPPGVRRRPHGIAGRQHHPPPPRDIS